MRRQMLRMQRLKQRHPMQKRKVCFSDFTTGLRKEVWMRMTITTKKPMDGENIKAPGTLRRF